MRLQYLPTQSAHRHVQADQIPFHFLFQWYNFPGYSTSPSTLTVFCFSYPGKLYTETISKGINTKFTLSSFNWLVQRPHVNTFAILLFLDLAISVIYPSGHFNTFWAGAVSKSTGFYNQIFNSHTICKNKGTRLSNRSVNSDFIFSPQIKYG